MQNIINPYDLVCAVEEAALLKRFLPYSKGSPKQSLTCDDQYDRANILFFSDSHIDFRNPAECLENVKRTVEFANTCPVKPDAVVNTGDAITPFCIVPKKDAMSRAEKFFELAKESLPPFIFAKGNHDTNDWQNLPENVIDDKDWGELFLNYAEEKHGIVRQTKKSGDKSTWHYYDIEDKKIRVISVDMQDTDKTTPDDEGYVKYYGGKSHYISNEQINWIAHTALNLDEKEEKDWGIILAFHQTGSDHPEHQSAATQLIKLCAAFQTQGTYENNFKCESNSFFDWDVPADYTRYASFENKPHIICCLLGHNHEDKHEVREGCIHLIWTLNNSCTTESSDARIVRIPGTPVQNSFDIVNIDTKMRKIRIFRYGAGTNCYGKGGDRFLPDGLDY